jgi:hypothetical protein
MATVAPLQSGLQISFEPIPPCPASQAPERASLSKASADIIDRWNGRAEQLISGLTEPPERESTPIVISPLAYLKTCLAILWSALRHPLQTTEIDMTTGHVVRRY